MRLTSRFAGTPVIDLLLYRFGLSAKVKFLIIGYFKDGAWTGCTL